MNMRGEVFLILLRDKLERARTDGYNSSYTDIALIVKDGTAEIMSVAAKMPKSADH